MSVECINVDELLEKILSMQQGPHDEIYAHCMQKVAGLLEDYTKTRLHEQIYDSMTQHKLPIMSEDECISANIDGIKVSISYAGICSVIGEEAAYNLAMLLRSAALAQGRKCVVQMDQIGNGNDSWKFAVVVKTQEEANRIIPYIVHYFSKYNVTNDDIACIKDGDNITVRIERTDINDNYWSYTKTYRSFVMKSDEFFAKKGESIPTCLPINFDEEKGIGKGPFNTEKMFKDGSKIPHLKLCRDNAPIVINLNTRNININMPTITNAINGNNNIINLDNVGNTNVNSDISDYIKANPPTGYVVTPYYKKFKEDKKNNMTRNEFNKEVKKLGFQSVKTRRGYVWKENSAN